MSSPCVGVGGALPFWRRQAGAAPPPPPVGGLGYVAFDSDTSYKLSGTGNAIPFAMTGSDSFGWVVMFVKPRAASSYSLMHHWGDFRVGHDNGWGTFDVAEISPGGLHAFSGYADLYAFNSDSWNTTGTPGKWLCVMAQLDRTQALITDVFRYWQGNVEKTEKLGDGGPAWTANDALHIMDPGISGDNFFLGYKGGNPPVIVDIGGVWMGKASTKVIDFDVLAGRELFFNPESGTMTQWAATMGGVPASFWWDGSSPLSTPVNSFVVNSGAPVVVPTTLPIAHGSYGERPVGDHIGYQFFDQNTSLKLAGSGNAIPFQLTGADSYGWIVMFVRWTTGSNNQTFQNFGQAFGLGTLGFRVESQLPAHKGGVYWHNVTQGSAFSVILDSFGADAWQGAALFSPEKWACVMVQIDRTQASATDVISYWQGHAAKTGSKLSAGAWAASNELSIISTALTGDDFIVGGGEPLNQAAIAGIWMGKAATQVLDFAVPADRELFLSPGGTMTQWAATMGGVPASLWFEGFWPYDVVDGGIGANRFVEVGPGSAFSGYVSSAVVTEGAA